MTSRKKADASNTLMLPVLFLKRFPNSNKVNTNTLLITEAEAPVTKAKIHSKGKMILKLMYLEIFLETTKLRII